MPFAPHILVLSILSPPQSAWPGLAWHGLAWSTPSFTPLCAVAGKSNFMRLFIYFFLLYYIFPVSRLVCCVGQRPSATSAPVAFFQGPPPPKLPRPRAALAALAARSGRHSILGQCGINYQAPRWDRSLTNSHPVAASANSPEKGLLKGGSKSRKLPGC